MSEGLVGLVREVEEIQDVLRKRKLGVSRERVRQIHEKGLQKVKAAVLASVA